MDSHFCAPGKTLPITKNAQKKKKLTQSIHDAFCSAEDLTVCMLNFYPQKEET